MRTLTEQAQDAQDQLGWTDVTDAMAMANAAVMHARTTVALARRVEQLEARLDAMAERMDRER